MGIKIKVPVKKLKKGDVLMKIEEKLRSDRENAYTVFGLMIELYGVKESEIAGKPFSAWKKGLPTMYSRISNCLKGLQKQGRVKSKKDGKAYVYWWAESRA